MTVMGEYFTPMPIWAEFLYYACMILAAACAGRDLYRAVRAPGRPGDPKKPRPARSRAAARDLFRAGAVCALAGLLLLLPALL